MQVEHVGAGVGVPQRPVGGECVGAVGGEHAGGHALVNIPVVDVFLHVTHMAAEFGVVHAGPHREWFRALRRRPRRRVRRKAGWGVCDACRPFACRRRVQRLHERFFGQMVDGEHGFGQQELVVGKRVRSVGDRWQLLVGAQVVEGEPATKQRQHLTLVVGVLLELAEHLHVTDRPQSFSFVGDRHRWEFERGHQRLFVTTGHKLPQLVAQPFGNMGAGRGQCRHRHRLAVARHPGRSLQHRNATGVLLRINIRAL